MTTKATVSREERLAMLLARMSLDPRQRGEVRELTSQVLDWKHLMRLAERHGLAPLFEHHLGMQGHAPKAIRARLWARSEARSRRNTAMAEELAAIAKLLDQHGIGCVPYKGPTLALRAYGDLAMREFGDLDLLVRARDVLKAKSILATRGYAPVTPLAPDQEQVLVASRIHYELGLVGRSPPITVELHWRADPTVAVPALDDEGWWSGLARTDVAGQSVRCLSSSESILVLCLHGSKHLWCSLGWLVDVVELARREPDIDWDWIFASARVHRCQRRLALGLLLAKDLLAANVPHMAHFHHAAVQEIASAIRENAFAYEPPPSSLWRALLVNLRLHDNLRQAAAYALRVAFTPGWGEWRRWHLPRPLFFFYWALRPIRLAAKYLTRSPKTPAAATPRTPPPRPRSTG
jgi:hypothetical protein